MNILITNDDGIDAIGMIELAKAMTKVGNVYVVAPDSQKSATGHAITVHNPIISKERYIREDIKAYAISGTPADCVKVGIEGILKDIEIDIIVSGINNGSNLGTDVIYSGTVSAAIEGFVQNKPSIAVSYNEFDVDEETYRKAAKYIVEIVDNIKDKMDIFKEGILNINIPNEIIKGYKITTLGERKYENGIEERISPRGEKYYWIAGTIKELNQREDSDITAIKEGYISITPVNIDMTNFKEIERLKSIKLL